MFLQFKMLNSETYKYLQITPEEAGHILRAALDAPLDTPTQVEQVPELEVCRWEDDDGFEIELRLFEGAYPDPWESEPLDVAQMVELFMYGRKELSDV